MTTADPSVRPEQFAELLPQPYGSLVSVLLTALQPVLDNINTSLEEVRTRVKHVESIGSATGNKLNALSSSLISDIHIAPIVTCRGYSLEVASDLPSTMSLSDAAFKCEVVLVGPTAAVPDDKSPNLRLKPEELEALCVEAVICSGDLRRIDRARRKGGGDVLAGGTLAQYRDGLFEFPHLSIHEESHRHNDETFYLVFQTTPSAPFLLRTVYGPFTVTSSGTPSTYPHAQPSIAPHPEGFDDGGDQVVTAWPAGTSSTQSPPDANSKGHSDWSGKSVGFAECDAIADFLKKRCVATSLDLSHNHINDAGARAIYDGLKHNNTVKVVVFADNKLGNSGMQVISDMMRRRRILEGINISDNDIGEDGAKILASGLSGNSTLTLLDMEGNNIQDEGASALCKGLTTATALRHLNLSGNSMSDDSSKVLTAALKAMKNLKSINLSYNNISSASSIIATVLKNKHLSEVDIAGNSTGDEGMDALGSVLATHPSMTSLDLSKNGVSDEAGVALSQHISGNELLLTIHMKGNLLKPSTETIFNERLQKSIRLQRSASLPTRPTESTTSTPITTPITSPIPSQRDPSDLTSPALSRQQSLQHQPQLSASQSLAGSFTPTEFDSSSHLVSPQLLHRDDSQAFMSPVTTPIARSDRGDTVDFSAGGSIEKLFYQSLKSMESMFKCTVGARDAVRPHANTPANTPTKAPNLDDTPLPNGNSDSAIQKSIEDIERRKSTLSAHSKALSETKKYLEEELSRAKAEVMELRMERENVEDEKRELADALSAEMEAKATLHSLKEGLEGQIKQLKAEREKSLRIVEQKLEKKTEEVKQLTEELKKCQKSLEEALGQVSTVRAELRDASSKNKTLEAKTQSLNARIEQLNSDSQDADAAAAVVAESRVAELEFTLQERVEESRTLAERVDQLQTALDDERTKRIEAESDKAHLEQANVELTGAVEEHKATIETLNINPSAANANTNTATVTATAPATATATTKASAIPSPSNDTQRKTSVDLGKRTPPSPSSSDNRRTIPSASPSKNTFDTLLQACIAEHGLKTPAKFGPSKPQSSPTQTTYHFGSKLINLEKKSGRVVVRVGMKLFPFEEYVKKNAPAEIRKEGKSASGTKIP